MISLMKFSKGHNFVKNEGGIIDPVFCILTDNALYSYQVS